MLLDELSAHGEALALGSGHSVVAEGLSQRGIAVDVVNGDWPRLLLEDGAPTIVDTRTATDRGRFGVIAGSIHVPRTLVEWHLDPANGYQHTDVTSFDQPLVLVCNGGYSSSLAAENLLDLGFTDVGDLVGGIRAWTAAGFEVVDPDHSHLDL